MVALSSANKLGIVVIGRNEGPRLISCLRSLRSHTVNTVYVDSGSTDGSTSAAEQLGVLVVRLNLALPFTAARARNEGFAALKELRPDIQFAQFVDGDCELAPDWLVTALTFIATRKDVAVVCGRRRERHPTSSVYNQLCDLEWDTPIGEALACGGDALVRVEAFEAAGGFLPQLIAGEEPELCVRLREIGWKIWRLDAEMTWHDAAMRRFGQWWVRSVRGGYAFAEVSRLHWTSPLGIWKPEATRAVIWGGFVPATIGLGALIHPAALGGTLVYSLQVIRIAFARGPTSYQSWKYALFVMLAKFAEFQGIVRFYWRSWRGKAATLIEYK